MKQIRPRKLKIAMLHFGFFYSGGGEKLVLEEIRGLRAMGNEVTCFAPYVDRKGCFPDYPEMAAVESLLPAPPRWIPLRHAVWVIACCLLVPLFARRFKRFDVIFAANQPAPWIAFVVSYLLGKPYVAYLAQPFRLLHPRKIDLNLGIRIRDGDQSFVKLISHVGRRFIDWADRASVRRANAVLTNGEYATKWISDIYGRETINCPAGSYPDQKANGKSHEKWIGAVEINGIKVTKPYLLVTNRHAPHKRFEYALWALKALSREMPEVSLVITGQESEYTVQLRYLVDGMGLAGSVNFVGLVSEEELTSLYREAAVYIYPAPEEDFGMGMIESMAAGTAVVAWDRAGPTGIVKHSRSGFLVTPFDTDEFADRILQLLHNRDLNSRCAAEGQQIAQSTFSYEKHNRAIASALQNALLDKPSFVDAPIRIQFPCNPSPSNHRHPRSKKGG